MKVLIDMNLSPSWVQFLSSHDIEAVHWSSIGSASEKDPVIFEYARTNGYVVFTNDLDFSAILAATNANAPSVFQVRTQNLLPSAIGKVVIECFLQYSSYLQQGSLVTLLDQKSKVRILPLRSF